MQLERRFDPVSDRARFVAGAKIARYRGIEGDALLRLLGSDKRDLESCRLAAGGLDDYSAASEATVELLPIGTILLKVDGLEHHLTPRLFPALATTASGSFYAGDGELDSFSREAADFVLAADGVEGLGRFSAAGSAPADVANMRFSGVLMENVVHLQRGADLVLTWDAESPRDRIELDILSGGSLLSCAARDDGEFIVSRGQLLGLEPDENASVSVRRVRLFAIDMAGVDSAYARVEASRATGVHVR